MAIETDLDEYALAYLGINRLLARIILMLQGNGNGSGLPVGAGGFSYPSGATPFVNHAASADASGTIQITTAPPTGKRAVILDIRFSSDTILQADISDSAAGIIFTEYVAANSGGQITLQGLLELALTGVLSVTTSGAGNVSFTVTGYFI